MLQSVTRREKYSEIKNRSTSNYGGYKMYFKLYREIIQQAKQHRKILNTKQQLQMFLIFLFKTPWWLVVKPLGQFFSVLTIIEGKYNVINGVFTNETIIKSKSFKLFKVTYFY